MKSSSAFLSFVILFFLLVVSPITAMGEEATPEEEHSFYKDNIFFFGNFSAYGVYSKLIGGSAIVGEYVNGYVAPAVKINDRLFFMIIANGFYKKSKQVYKEDQGSRLSSEALSYTFTPKLKINISDALSISPSYFVTRFLSKQTTDVKWGKDLYDYKDIGMGIDMSYEIEKTEVMVRKASFGMQVYKRKYPNYISLLTLSGLGNVEEKEKDYDGILIMGDYNVVKRKGLSYKPYFTILLKDFVDKKIENNTGGRDPKPQRDEVYTVGLDLTHKPDDSFTYILNSTGVYTNSNQNLAEGTFPSIVFRKNYYSSLSITEKGGITYAIPLPEEKVFKIGASYSVTWLQYTSRRAKDLNAAITASRELDIDHEITVTSSYKFHKNWDVNGNASYHIARSNNKDESTFRYNYEMLTVYLGITFNY